jgi:hypothetical protein
MTTPSDVPRRYQIVFLGECREVLADVLGDAAIESRHGYTRVVAAVRDQSEFYGLLDRFADLALWPVSLIELGTEHLVTRNGRPAHSTREAAEEIVLLKDLVLIQLRAALIHRG